MLKTRSLSHLSPSLAFIFFALLFTSHRSPLSERLEQATMLEEVNTGGAGVSLQEWFQNTEMRR